MSEESAAECGQGDKHVLAETQVAGFGLANGKVVERLLIEFDRETPAAKLVHDRLDYAEPIRDRAAKLEMLGKIVANPHDSHRDGEQKLEIGSSYGKDRVIVDYHEHAPRVYIRHEHFDNGGWSEAAAWELHPATGVEEVGGELVTDGGQTLEEQKESHRLGTINRWDAPEADWAAEYDWTRYRGPKPYPAPEDWVLDEPEGGIVGWQRFPDVGKGHGLLDDVYDELEGDYDDWDAYEAAVEEASGVRAFLSNDIVEDGRGMDVILEHELSIGGDTVFRRVDPRDDELWARTAEALARYADGESVEEFADDIGFQSGRLPDDLQEERENERRREENAGLDEFATDGGQPAEDGRAIVQTRDENAYVGVCTECGLEDTLPVSNADPLPDVGEVVEEYICDCGNTTWEVTGYDRLVFQRESRFAEGPDISGTWHRYGELEWRRPPGSEGDELRERPECPVSQRGSVDESIGCDRLAERVTGPDGKSAWKCGWHGAFRVFDYPRNESTESEQATLIADGGADQGREIPHDAPEKARDLDATVLLGLDDHDVGDTIWVPVSPIRGDKFRAYKITIEERVSVGNYEEIHAIDKWPKSDRAPISHEVAEGYDAE